MYKEFAKQKIQKLVAKYEEILNSGKVKSYTEEETKKDFILPLFEALGWDVYEKSEVSAEEHIKSAGRVDYGFSLNGRTKFYLEAKSLKTDLNVENFAKQAIRYSWNRGVTWAVLTDFESLKVFNAQAVSKYLGDKLYFEIKHTEYANRFDQLWQLSKEMFKNDIIDRKAEKVGKKLQKVSVTASLYKDFNECRNKLTTAFRVWNERLDPDILDEGVQKLLDRLIFIRVAEDRGIEPATLQPLLRAWKSNPKGNQVPFYASIVSKFRELDSIYNSNLFSFHPFEEWEEYDNVTEDVINMLYGKPGYYEYDFKAMSADVLGAVYENYLGYRLSQSKKKVAINKDEKKRKEHGIYYTPAYIVDYIVQHALKPVLDRCRGIEDLKKIRILDPACGSGSFLIKAADLIADRYRYFNAPVNYITKVQILSENIYGVDLDLQAVEIARLNLLINALDTQFKLPLLSHNIRNGNSLISETDAELKKYFGPNWRDKKPFNWQEEFPEVFKQGGFDVIIGNPPYGAELSKNEQSYFSETYNIGSSDTAMLFIKKAWELLNQSGRLGFIVPKAFCFASNWSKIRDYLWDHVSALVDCGKAWKEVLLEQVIVVVTKGYTQSYYESLTTEASAIKLIGAIDKKVSKEFNFFLNGISFEELKIGKKIKDNSIFLNDIATNQRGAMLQKEIGEEGDVNVIGGAQITRAGIQGIKGKIDKAKILDTKAFVKENSIVVQNIIAHIENPEDHIKITAALPPNAGYGIVDTVNQITISDKSYAPFFVCALLNSKLVNWYAYRFIFGKAIRTMHFDNFVTSRIPIPRINRKEDEMGVVESYRELMKLHGRLEARTEGSEARNEIKSKIARTDHKIDQEVYKLYGLTAQEINIIENAG